MRAQARFWLAKILLVSGLWIWGSGQAHAFQPNNLSGLTLWLKADSITGVNDGQAFGFWGDSSGSNNHFSQSTANQKPTYKSSVAAFDNMPVVRFDGNDYLETANSFSLNDFSLFVVYMDNGTREQFERLVDHDHATGFWLGRNDTTRNSWGGGIKNATSPYGSFGRLRDSNAHLLNVEREDGAFYLIGDGALFDAQNVDISATTSKTIRLGNRVDTGAGPDQFLKGDIAEVIMFNRSLTDLERIQVEEYVEIKYAIPVGHIGIKTVSSTAPITVNGMLKLTPLADAPGNCDTTTEGGIFYHSAIKYFYGCNGSEWRQLAYGNALGADAFTKLLIHFNGTGSTFTDSSPSAHTVTASGNANQVSTPATPLVGGNNVGSFDGNGDYLSVADSGDWNLGSGNFTVDFWVRWNGSVTASNFFGQRVDGSNFYTVWWEPNLFRHELRIGGSILYSITWRWTPVADTWYHIALVRNGAGNDFKFFVNGSEISVNSFYGSGASIPDLSASLDIAKNHSVGGNDHNGQIEEFRFSKGIARWTSNFTTPTAPY